MTNWESYKKDSIVGHKLKNNNIEYDNKNNDINNKLSDSSFEIKQPDKCEDQESSIFEDSDIKKVDSKIGTSN